MLVLVTYDISTSRNGGQKRLRKIAQACSDFGQRVQNSVFECELAPDQWVMLRARLLSLYNSEEDSLRFYFLGKKGAQKIEHHGIKEVPNLTTDTLII